MIFMNSFFALDSQKRCFLRFSVFSVLYSNVRDFPLFSVSRKICHLNVDATIPTLLICDIRLY